MRPRESAQAVNEVDTVSLQLILDNGNLAFDNPLNPKAEICHGDLIFGVIVGAVEALLVEAGKMENGFAHGFAGDGAGVGADAADGRLFFNEGNAFASFYCLNGGALPARTGTNHNQFIRLHSWIPV